MYINMRYYLQIYMNIQKYLQMHVPIGNYDFTIKLGHTAFSLKYYDKKIKNNQGLATITMHAKISKIFSPDNFLILKII